MKPEYYDYQKYNIAVGQMYARADDITRTAALFVVDVLTYAECGDVVVRVVRKNASVPASEYLIDCFKLSKVRYVLLEYKQFVMKGTQNDQR